MPGTFSLYLKRTGRVLGPSLRKTRHSDLSTLKAWLLGYPISFGYKDYNNFGRAVHLKFLLRRDGTFKLTKEEKIKREAMIQSLNCNLLVRRIMSLCPIREVRKPATLNGVKIGFTPDARGRGIVMDLKTTVCATLKAFLIAAFKYGYFRQGLTYSLALGKIAQYWIVGIQKERPYKVHLVLIQNHRDWMTYVAQELSFLLYFYKHYGNPNFRQRSKAV